MRPERLTARMNDLDRILVPTAFMQQVMFRYGIEDHCIGRIGYGIDPTPFEHLPARGSADGLRLSFIGSLTEHKGAHVLVEALRALPADLPVDVSMYNRLDEVPVPRRVDNAHHKLFVGWPVRLDRPQHECGARHMQSQRRGANHLEWVCAGHSQERSCAGRNARPRCRAHRVGGASRARHAPALLGPLQGKRSQSLRGCNTLLGRRNLPVAGSLGWEPSLH